MRAQSRWHPNPLSYGLLGREFTPHLQVYPLSRGNNRKRHLVKTARRTAAWDKSRVGENSQPRTVQLSTFRSTEQGYTNLGWYKTWWLETPGGFRSGLLDQIISGVRSCKAQSGLIWESSLGLIYTIINSTQLWLGKVPLPHLCYRESRQCFQKAYKHRFEFARCVAQAENLHYERIEFMFLPSSIVTWASAVMGSAVVILTLGEKFCVSGFWCVYLCQPLSLVGSHTLPICANLNCSRLRGAFAYCSHGPPPPLKT